MEMENSNTNQGKIKTRLSAPIKVLVYSYSDRLSDSFRELPDFLSGAAIDIVDGTTVSLDKSLIARHKPDVLVADVHLTDVGDIERLSHLTQKPESGVYLIATSAESDVEGVRRLLRVGANDFLPQPIDISELVASLQSAARKYRKRESGPSSEVVVFLHGNGGAGATTLAINSAVAFRRQNKDARVCILDFDIQFGQVALNLDLASNRGILDIIESPERLDATLFDVAMTSHKSGIDVLSAPNILVALDSLSPQLATQIIDIAAENYDFVIIDMPITLTDTSQAILARSNAVVLVGQITVPGLQQLRRLASILAADGVGNLNTFVVLNRYLGRWKSDISLKDAEKAIGRRVDCTISNDYKVANAAIDRGVPLVEVSRRARVTKDIFKLTEKISSKIASVS